jgi:DnaJ-class molecular chaperone
MKRRHFLATVPGFALVSCVRDEQRAKRYDPHECPFCVTKKGICTYCNGTLKCPLCGGKGKRTTVVPDLPEKGITKSSYEEVCSYCGGNGVCRYCNGKGSCWACGGSGRIESWDFFEKQKSYHGNK